MNKYRPQKMFIWMTNLSVFVNVNNCQYMNFIFPLWEGFSLLLLQYYWHVRWEPGARDCRWYPWHLFHCQSHAHTRLHQTFERAPNLSLGSSQLAPIIKWVLVLHCKEDFFLVLLWVPLCSCEYCSAAVRTALLLWVLVCCCEWEKLWAGGAADLISPGANC